MLNFKSSKINLYICALAALLAIAQASIENKPVKVTHQNSGPSYDIDEVEKTKLTPEREDGQIMRHLPFQPHAQAPPPKSKVEEEEQQQQPGDNDGPLVGHINIRRIFLIPMSQPSQDDDRSPTSNIWSTSGQPSALGPAPSRQQNKQPEEDDRTAPVWPFLSLIPTRHVFGADQASRSPSRSEEGLLSRPSTILTNRSPAVSSERERENTPETHQRPPFDPIQMMIEMMQQAISQAIMTPNGPFQDLNKESETVAAAKPIESDNKAESSETTSGNTDANEVPKRPNTELEQPFKQPVSRNSTKEEVVEIDGKKYLKKTVVNRHVGENIIFMTKRLLFVPLNETSSVDNIENKGENTSPIPPEEVRKGETTSATTPSPTTTTVGSPSTTEASTTTTTVASTTISESPSTTSTTSTTPDLSPTTSTISTPTSIASEANFKDKVAEAIEKVSERLVNSVSSSS